MIGLGHQDLGDAWNFTAWAMHRTLVLGERMVFHCLGDA
jgi:hypothetical protein